MGRLPPRLILTYPLFPYTPRFRAIADAFHLGELSVQPVDDLLALAPEHPHHQAQRPHVLAAQRLFLREAEGLDRFEGEPGDVQLHHLVGGEAFVSQRADLVAGLLQVAVVEAAGVHADEAAGLARKSVVWGKSGYVRVGLGGRRIIKKKKEYTHKLI